MISIVTPTYNRKEMLHQMIESIRMQTYQDFEIIVIDDNSTDGTEKFIARYKEDKRIRYYRNPQNMGPGYNRNFGYKQAKGQYVVFVDDDDYYTDVSFFADAVRVFDENSDKNLAAVAANAFDEYIESGKREKEYIGAEGFVDGIEFLTNLEIKYHKPLSTFPAVFSMDALKQADFEHMKMVNDYAIYIRALLYGDIYILPSFVGNYRKHDGNISLKIKKEFLIENLEERKWVKDRLKGRTQLRNIEKWWNVQMRILFTYYVAKSKPSRSDALEVTSWIFKNSGISPSLWFMIIIRFFKIKIKQLFGIQNFRKKLKSRGEE